MITYSPQGKSGVIEVQLEGKNIGQIRTETAPFGSPVDKIYRYWPKGINSVARAGHAFASLAACKRSLEG